MTLTSAIFSMTTLQIVPSCHQPPWSEPGCHLYASGQRGRIVAQVLFGSYNPSHAWQHCSVVSVHCPRPNSSTTQQACSSVSHSIPVPRNAPPPSKQHTSATLYWQPPSPMQHVPLGVQLVCAPMKAPAALSQQLCAVSMHESSGRQHAPSDSPTIHPVKGLHAQQCIRRPC